jgi:hypothetical protein
VSTDVWCVSCVFYILSIHSNPTALVFLTRYPFYLPSSLVCSLCNPPPPHTHTHASPFYLSPSNRQNGHELAARVAAVGLLTSRRGLSASRQRCPQSPTTSVVPKASPVVSLTRQPGTPLLAYGLQRDTAWLGHAPNRWFHGASQRHGWI